MFKNQSESDQTQTTAETIIGPSIKVEGDFTGKGDIIIEGVLTGSVKTEQHLTIGQSSEVTANIESNSAKISGVVKGNIINKQHLEITSTGKIFGDIKTASISVEQGANINGQITMSSTSTQTSKE